MKLIVREIVVDDDLRWRAAKQLIEIYGACAYSMAFRRAQKMVESSRDNGNELWRDIALKVTLLQATPETRH